VAGSLLAVGVALALLPALATYAAGSDRVVFRIRSSEITESSSLVVSTRHEGLAYTTNDSGDAAVVYVLDTRTGRLVGRTRLAGVEAEDIEALGGAADGSLVVADIGDNSAERDQVAVYRIDQPGIGDQTVTPDVLHLRYAGGPRDAESVWYDDSSGRVFVASKELGDAHIYRTGRRAFARSSAVLHPIAAAPLLATDATYVPGGDFVVIRGYGDATVFRTAGWARVARFDLPLQEQGESIAAPRSGRVVWVGSEGERSPVLEVPLPSLPVSSVGPSESRSPGPGPDGSGSGGPGNTDDAAATQQAAADADADRGRAIEAARWVGGVAAAGLVLVVLLLIVRSRRTRHS
jgi:hypothetical protein